MNKKRILRFGFCCVLLQCTFILTAQHTFSIVAVDSATGEVGSAGATCLSLDREGYQASIISYILPGKGAIHTQSYWHPVNQFNGSVKLEEDLSASELLDWLVKNDAEANPTIRQYGIALYDKTGQPSAAGYTGVNCFNAKKHKSGRTYSIQGNILLKESIIDSMETAFLNSKGTLAERLMASMKAALIPGADSRCLAEGLSSRSSFLRVARPSDTIQGPYLDITVGSTLAGVDPIDSLARLFELWKPTRVQDEINNPSHRMVCYQSGDQIVVKNTVVEWTDRVEMVTPDGLVHKLIRTPGTSQLYELPANLDRAGFYILKASGNTTVQSCKIILKF